jgi:hypothetical protein
MTEEQTRARTAWIVWIVIIIAVATMVVTLMRPGPPNPELNGDAAPR